MSFVFELFKFVPLLKIAVKFSIGQGARPLSAFIMGKQGEHAVSAVPAQFFNLKNVFIEV